MSKASDSVRGAPHLVLYHLVLVVPVLLLRRRRRRLQQRGHGERPAAAQARDQSRVEEQSERQHRCAQHAARDDASEGVGRSRCGVGRGGVTHRAAPPPPPPSPPRSAAPR